MCTVLVVLASALAMARGYNLEPRHAVVVDDPQGDRQSYFGYSLSFWQRSGPSGNKTWLLVGAPRASLYQFRGDRVRQPGAVYKCSLDSLHCSTISILGPEDVKQQDLKWRREEKNIPARAWMGATIAVEDKLDGGVAVCAPRMKRMVQKDGWLIPGRCYYWKDEKNISSLALLSSVPFKPGINKDGFLAGLATVGMSAHFVLESTSSKLIVGAPGVEWFKGAMAVYHDNWQKQQGWLSSLLVPLATETKFDNYMGYSVTSARFHSYRGQVSYVAGVPRGAGEQLFSGVVLVLSNPYKQFWTRVSTLKGEQMGEYYGACVAATDVDQDGQDDLLLVGAPLYSLKSTSEEALAGDQGRVYVYVNKGEARLELFGTLSSSAPGARFGSSIANIGDINRDGFNDVAVGAPYEEGAGAVYIYHGQDGGLKRLFSQRILGSDINTNNLLSGFGIAISSGVDVDDNSFNDIAIGSYSSSNVVLIKSYPVINFEASLEPNVKKLDTFATNFTVNACLRYSTSARTDLLQRVEAEVTIRVDQNMRRAALHNTGSRQDHIEVLNTPLTRNVFYCRNFDIKLKGNTAYVIQPIEISLEYKIADTYIYRENFFCKLCPVVDPHKPTLVHTKVPFAHGCKKDVCLADLKVVAQSSTNGGPIVLGMDSRVSMNVTVTNTGEPAYLAMLALTLPARKMLVKLPKDCYLKESDLAAKSSKEVILCNLGNPLTAGSNTYNLVLHEFEVDVSFLSTNIPVLTLNVTAWSSSEETKPTDNTVIINIPVRLVSRVDIIGNTLQTHIRVVSEGGNDTNDIPVIHKYEVINYGPSPVETAIIQFKVPIGYFPPRASKELVYAQLAVPHVVIAGHIFRCKVDYKGLDAPNVDSLSRVGGDPWLLPGQLNGGSESVDTTNLLSRSRRSLTDWVVNDTNADQFRGKRILYLNCSEGVKMGAECALVTCEAGPLSSQNRAEIKLQLFINRTVLGTMLNDVNVIQISSLGRVDIRDDDKYDIAPDYGSKVARVDTVLMGEDDLPSWIVPLAIALGLFMLLILVKCLSNYGFFKRSTKEKLAEMKEKAAEEEFDTVESLSDYFSEDGQDEE